eukprot:TRINITY_DN3561_c0_g1_i3.p1 TRINITY_DN3561_c0_g1~~TRINITY_DN3561_c0_g1_i3.p1  ORF type:complete len:178 (+),score=34.61 TRINITY_DN3561_c0_g1_i3:262-795(+)
MRSVSVSNSRKWKEKAEEVNEEDRERYEELEENVFKLEAKNGKYAKKVISTRVKIETTQTEIENIDDQISYLEGEMTRKRVEADGIKRALSKTDTKFESLQQELVDLSVTLVQKRERDICKQCKVNQRSVVLFPCSHLYMCEECALVNGVMPARCLCRTRTVGYITVQPFTNLESNK